MDRDDAESGTLQTTRGDGEANEDDRRHGGLWRNGVLFETFVLVLRDGDHVGNNEFLGFRACKVPDTRLRGPLNGDAWRYDVFIIFLRFL